MVAAGDVLADTVASSRFGTQGGMLRLSAIVMNALRAQIVQRHSAAERILSPGRRPAPEQH
jgi:hypothetical protein